MKEPLPDAEEGQINDDNSDSAINILDDAAWISQFDSNIDSNLLESMTNEYQNSIQRTPNDLKKDLIRQTFPDSSQINPLISNLLFSKSQISQLSLLNAPLADSKQSIDDSNPAKRPLYDGNLSNNHAAIKAVTKMEYTQYKEFSKNILSFIEHTKKSYKLANSADPLKH